MGELTPLKDILQELLHPTPEQLEAEQCRELSFRRGYQHGFNLGVDAVLRLWQEGRSREEVARLCRQHDDRLVAWRVSRPFAMTEPPAFRDGLIVEARKEREDADDD